MDDNAFLNVLFNLGMVVSGISMVIALIARYTKRKRLQLKSGIAMFVGGAVMFGSTLILNSLAADHFFNTGFIVNAVILAGMVMGILKGWRKLKEEPEQVSVQS
jgi:MFS family permease